MPVQDLERGSVPGYWKKFRHMVTRRGSLTSRNFIDRLAEAYEDRTCFFLDRELSYPFFTGNRVSYRDLARFVNRIGNTLLSLGVSKGDRVGLVTYNRVELAFAEFACMKIGAVPVPLNYMLKADEIHYQMENSGARVLITDRNVFRHNIKEQGRVPSVRTWIMVAPSDETPDGFHSLGGCMASASEELSPADLASDDEVVLIFYTSGTTGVPRGAMLTNRNIMFTVRKYSAIFGFLPASRKQLALLVMPVAHTSGHQNLLILLSMALPMYFMSRFDPAEVLDLIESYRATFFAGIPAMFKMLLHADAERRDLTSIQVWGGGADAFPPELVKKFRDMSRRRRWGVSMRPMFVHGYGMAESAGSICISPPWGPRCAGWVLPGIRHRIVDISGQPVQEGEAGELQIQGPSVMKGYWNDPAKTESSFQEGWFRTGDIMKKGKLGVLEFVDREKDVIKCGGYSVFPTEVEHQLLENPKIERAVVVGIPHALKGEMPVAAVILEEGEEATEEEFVEWADDRIAPYKRPRRYIFLPSIPMTFSLKPLRKDVRKTVMEVLGEDWEIKRPGRTDRSPEPSEPTP